MFSFTLLLSVSGQVLIELGRTADKLNAYSGINIYGSGELKNNITCNRINGSPFWDDAWRSATLYDHQHRSFGKWKVRLNLVTQEIHFLDSLNQERTIGAQYVQKILFTDSLNNNAGKIFIGGIPDMVKQEIKKHNNYYL
jgi:hypothetical protein